MQALTIGADPEVFVGDATGVRSIIDRIGGTKEYPRPLPIGDGFAVQEDNVALEFNIPPANSRAEFVGNIQLAMRFLESSVRDAHGLQFVKDSAISFPEEELNDPRARMFGCDPDYDAWTGKRNPRPKADDPNLRSCGGHVHIGVKGTKDEKMAVIQYADLVLGVPSVIMDKGFLRKKLYGKPGAFRFKPFGVEYRVLSNFWIFTPELTGWVYDGVERCLGMLEDRTNIEEDGAAIIQCIGNNDADMAQHLIQKYNLQLA
jgi:hypothetical protein